MPWKERRVDSFDELVAIINEKRSENWIYRGQSSADYKLKSSLARNKNLVSRDVEKCLICKFNEKAHLYPEGRDYDCEDELETLALMQHYGAPTRLLDWSYSPFVALFFAINNTSSDKDAALYCLNWKYVETLNEFKIWNIDERISKYNAESKENKIECNQDMNAIEFGDIYEKLSQKDNLEEDIFLQKYEPRKKNNRIDKQQGLFLISSKIDVEYEDVLSSYYLDKGVINEYKCPMSMNIKNTFKKAVDVARDFNSKNPDLDKVSQLKIKIDSNSTDYISILKNAYIKTFSKSEGNNDKINLAEKTKSINPFECIALKIIITPRIKKDVLKYLQLMNISNEFLFPEMEGFCAGLKHKML
ncbi:MAG: FRG domain-containing protein [Tissierellales bacterium]|nr:FRG domain-containing protein [Tissierellales bacterium]